VGDEKQGYIRDTENIPSVARKYSIFFLMQDYLRKKIKEQKDARLSTQYLHFPHHISPYVGMILNDTPGS
jgi:hypothetical protein